ncbi:MAG: hypothetical protein ACI86H_002240, partial [bacterium]
MFKNSKFMETENSKEEKLHVDLLARFYSHVGNEYLRCLSPLRQGLKSRGFAVENLEFKITVTKEVKRLINPKNPNGPSERVHIEEKTNLNTDAKALRSYVERVLREPYNVLLAQIYKARSESFALPIVFPNLFRVGGQVLVSYSDELTRLQLLTVPDLKFEKIPKIVEENSDFKDFLIGRGKRKKGIQSAMRELVDLPLLPEDLRKRITSVAMGQVHNFNEIELINLLLIADLHSRYSAIIKKFEMDWDGQVYSVELLSGMFSELVKNADTAYLKMHLSEYLDGEEYFMNNNTVFPYLYNRYFNLDYDAKSKFEQKTFTRLTLRHLVRNLIVFTRSQNDPEH